MSLMSSAHTLLASLLSTCTTDGSSADCHVAGLQSKELAIMLPVVLLCYEYWLGNGAGNGSSVLAVSLLFGIQALLCRPSQ